MILPHRFLLLGGCALLVAFAAPSSAEAPAAPVVKTVHLFNLPNRESEAQMAAIMNEFNDTFASLGQPDVKYRLWRVNGRRQGEFSYMWESTWPDRATYDRIHRDGAYRRVAMKHARTLRSLVDREVYNRYAEVTGAAVTP